MGDEDPPLMSRRRPDADFDILTEAGQNLHETIRRKPIEAAPYYRGETWGWVSPSALPARC